MEASSSGGSSQSSDLFIVLEPFREGFAQFVRALEPLSSAATDGDMLGTSDVYYRADTDIALLTIRLDRKSLSPQKLAWLTSVAARADLPVLDPGRLGFRDRRAFYEDYLPNYRVRVEARGGPKDALEELARLLGLPDAPPMRSRAPSTRPPIQGMDSAARRIPIPAPRAAGGTDPDGRYGAARSVGHGPGARAARRASSEGPALAGKPGANPGASAAAATSGASSSGANSGGAGSSGGNSASNSGAAQPRMVDYSALSRGPRMRRHRGPALTAPEAPRVQSPEQGDSDHLARSLADAPAPAATGPAIYTIGRELAGAESSPGQPSALAPVAPPARVAAAPVVPAPGMPHAPAAAAPAPSAPQAAAAGAPVVPAPGTPHPRVAPVPVIPPARAAAAPVVPTPAAPQARVAPAMPTTPPAAGRSPSGTSPASVGQGWGLDPAAASADIAPAPTADTVPRPKRPALIVDDDFPALQVRFLRGDQWAPARLRALSLQGARLAAAAPPRPGDTVQVAIGLDHLDVVLIGEVTQVTTAAQAAGTGEPSGFALHFNTVEGQARSKLISLLKRAKQGGISLRPPPPRASVRFPVRWPTGIITSWGELNTAALDVSRSGLFLAVGTTIGARELIFNLPMDTAGRALSGRAQVAREVTEEMAAQRGLTRGYGVRIIDFTRNDGARYDAFLERVRLRTEKRVLIAARRELGTELGRGLMAAGYAVHSGSDLGVLAESMNDTGPPPDAALIDAGLAASDPSAIALKRALGAHHVPCLTIGNEQAERARVVVDHLLQIT